MSVVLSLGKGDGGWTKNVYDVNRWKSFPGREILLSVKEKEGGDEEPDGSLVDVLAQFSELTQ